jgi:hypothetical protein
MSRACKAVYCPKKEDHENHKKIAFLFDNDGLYVYCKLHGWVKFEFNRMGKKIEFSNASISATDLPPDIHFDLEEIPIIATGDFNKRI